MHGPLGDITLYVVEVSHTLGAGEQPKIVKEHLASTQLIIIVLKLRWMMRLINLCFHRMKDSIIFN